MGNKKDVEPGERKVTESEGLSTAKKVGIHYVEISAAENLEIDEVNAVY